MGGICGFMHTFLAEVLSILRANVSSLGGNALVSYKMSQCVLMSNPHKNQVRTDVAFFLFEEKDPKQFNLMSQVIRKPAQLLPSMISIVTARSL